LDVLGEYIYIYIFALVLLFLFLFFDSNQLLLYFLFSSLLGLLLFEMTHRPYYSLLEYTSIDWDEKFNPTHCFDICDWEKYIAALQRQKEGSFNLDISNWLVKNSL